MNRLSGINIDPDTFDKAIEQCVAEHGGDYQREDIEQALLVWIESSVEELLARPEKHLFSGEYHRRFNANEYSEHLDYLAQKRAVDERFAEMRRKREMRWAAEEGNIESLPLSAR